MVVGNKYKNLEKSITNEDIDLFKDTVDNLHEVPVDIQMRLIMKHYDEFIEYLIRQDKLSPETYSLSAATGDKVQQLIKCKKLKEI